MAANQPLTGIELIDCAKANAAQGVTEAARLCGYASNISGFQQALTKAGEDMGIELSGLDDLITDQSVAMRQNVLEVAPDSPQNL